MLPNNYDITFHAMELVKTFSKSLNTFSWIWGGYVVDIYQKRILREHDDLDYLTLNLHQLIPNITNLFENRGWQVNRLDNGDLKLEGEGAKIQMGHVESSDRMRWTHNGEKGSIWFPIKWLPTQPIMFLGLEINVVEPEFQYVMLERPQMLNPNWRQREKDNVAREILSRYVKSKQISPQSLFEQVSIT